MRLRRDRILERAAGAFAGLVAMAAPGALGAVDQDPFYNSGLFLLCDSPQHAEQLACTTYLAGFAEGYIQNSHDRCYAPTAAKLREEYLLTIRHDPTLLRDRSGSILFSLMDRLTSTKCALPGQKAVTK